MLTARAQGLSVLLTMISFIGCVQKFDYNCGIGLGLIYLGSKHPYLHNLPSFYFLIGFTIVIDVLSIILTNGIVPVFPRFVVTIIEIIIKIGIMIMLGLQARKDKMKKENRVINEFQ